MFPKTITITVTSAAEETLVERALAMARDLNDLAGAAPAGQVLDCCEEAAVAKGREFTLHALEQAVAQRIEVAQKKGRRLGDACAVTVVKAKVPANEAC
jgi:hypothetical protein